eukprot:scaffold71517_cov55-Phaeocystis_antarctica.AAC.9
MLAPPGGVAVCGAESLSSDKAHDLRGWGASLECAHSATHRALNDSPSIGRGSEFCGGHSKVGPFNQVRGVPTQQGARSKRRDHRGCAPSRSVARSGRPAYAACSTPSAAPRSSSLPRGCRRSRTGAAAAPRDVAAARAPTAQSSRRR